MRTLVSAVALLLHAGLPAIAQDQPVSRPPVQGEVAAAPSQAAVSSGDGGISFAAVFSDLGRELARLPSKGTAIALGVGGAFALAAHPADREITRRATGSVPLDHLFEFGESAGSGWVQAGAAVGTFVVGRATGSHRVQAVGADLVQAQILVAVLTQGLKRAVDRRRPDAGRFSFPSGHTSGTFANATVLHRHFGWKVGLPAYALAAYVGGSRLQENRHYASDVLFGAAIGIVAGRTVTVGRGASRFAVSPMAVQGGAGVAFTHVP